MVRTQKFGKLDLIGYVKIRSYDKLYETTNCEKYYLSSSYPRFYGGEVYRAEDSKIIITSYSRVVHPRFLPLRKIYIYRLYVMSERDFETIKSKLNFTPN